MDRVSVDTVRFAASDGWLLEGEVFRGPEPQIAVMISAGTGFPRRFYRHAASYLAARGAVVLTYDYRGIGGSAAGNLKHSGIDYPDWGRFDMPAALETLAATGPGLPLTHLAHSVGGHFLGLMPNHARIARHAFASVGTGYFGGHHLRNLPLEFYFWWGMGSYSLLRHGYVKPVGGWQGEPLPPRLFRTWRRWSHRRAYFRSDLGTRIAPHAYHEVASPIRSWIFPDDPIATPRSARDLLDCYPNAPNEIVHRRPAEAGVRRIGHEGAFRPGREALWAEWWQWLSGAAAAEAQAMCSDRPALRPEKTQPPRKVPSSAL